MRPLRYDDVSFLHSLEKAKLLDVLTNIVGLGPNDAGAFCHAMHCDTSAPPEPVSISSDPEAASAPPDKAEPEAFEALLGQLGLSADLKAFEDEGCAAQD